MFVLTDCKTGGVYAVRDDKTIERVVQIFVDKDDAVRYYEMLKDSDYPRKLDVRFMEEDDVKMSCKNYANYLYIVNLNKINLDIINYRGKYGIFFEYNSKDLKILKKIVSRKIQTLTYFGFLKKNLINFMLKNKLNGIDRIVPFGRALDLSLTWDGFDLIRYLSREIEVS